MHDTRTRGDHRGLWVVVVTAVLALTGAALVLRGLTAAGPPPQPDQTTQASATHAAQSPSVTQPQPPKPSTPVGQPQTPLDPIMRPSPPVALSIPTIGVNTSGIVDLHLDTHGQLEAPTDFDRAGWYADGPTPGEFGPAVIGAHVDSKAGPAVFYRLGALRPGARIQVTRQDGSTVSFVVDRVAKYAKARFPTSLVYGDTRGRAELRLITCGGAFDRASGHYVDNIVAFAHLVAQPA